MSILDSQHDEALIDLEFDDVVATMTLSPAVSVETTTQVAPQQRQGLLGRFAAHLRAQSHAAQLTSLLATQPSLRQGYLYALARGESA